MKREKVFVISRLRATPERTLAQNLERARMLCRLLFLAGYDPECGHLYFTQFLNDENAEEREAGIAAGKARLASCSRAFVDTVFGLSSGMAGDIEAATQLAKPLIFDPPEWRALR